MGERHNTVFQIQIRNCYLRKPKVINHLVPHDINDTHASVYVHMLNKIRILKKVLKLLEIFSELLFKQEFYSTKPG